MNETLKNIKSRFSCRAFKDGAPEKEKIGLITAAAVQSPSALNRQPWQIIAVTDKALISELEDEGFEVISQMKDKSVLERINSRGGKLFYNASCVIIIAVNELPDAKLDCGIVCQTITLAARSLGLDSCIHGLTGLAFSRRKSEYFKKKLKFPDGYTFGAAVLIGEAAKEFSAHTPYTNKITFIE